MSDKDYFMLHPLNNHFQIWINDKLTLKYMLNTTYNNLIKLMPEYYLYIENDGCYSYLMDAPDNIPKNENFIINLLKNKGKLALKPSRGQQGDGFYKLEYKDNVIYKNELPVNHSEFDIFISQLKGYLIIEYINQHRDLKKITGGGSESALRIIIIKNKYETIYTEPKYYCITAIARIGTLLSGIISTCMKGAVGIKFDFETGLFEDKFFIYNRFKENFSKDNTCFLDVHPDTKISLKGKILPNHDILKNVTINICRYLSSLEFFGFDFIITDEGVRLLEINTHPDIYQECYGPLLAVDPTKSFFEQKKKKRNMH